MVKKEYAEKKHDHPGIWWSLWILIILLSATNLVGDYYSGIEVNSLKEEIELMPHYECWNETNRTEYNLCFQNCIDSAYSEIPTDVNINISDKEYEMIQLKVKLAYYDYEDCAIAKGCLDIKSQKTEVCKLNKDVFRDFKE